LIKIIHILGSTGLGGVQKNLLNKSAYDKTFNIKRSVICIIRNNGSLKKEFNNSNIEISNCLMIPSDNNYRPYRLFKLIRKIISLFFIFRLYFCLKKHSAKIVHSEDTSRILSQIIASKLANKVFIWQLHTNFKLIKNRFIAYILLYLINRNMITMIADSVSTIKSNIPNLINNNMYQIIPPGIDFKKFQYCTKNNRLRESYSLNKEHIILGSVGRLHEQKGFHILIGAMEKIIIKYKNLVLFIAGDGPMRRSLKKMIQNLHLEERVILCGSIKNVPSFLNNIDIFIQPSLYEGFPLSVIEAVAAQKPIIATNVGGVPEIVIDKETGILVDRNSIEGLARGIDRMLAMSKKQKSDLVQSGYEKCHKYTSELSVKKDLAVYNNLVRK